MKIVLIDNISDGHHEIYEKTLSSINNTIIINKRIKFEVSLKKTLEYIKTRRGYVKEIINKCDEKDILHFLYVDNLYVLGYFFPNMKNNCLATLHFFPSNKMKIWLLKKFSKRINKIVVHSEYIKKQCIDNGILNVEHINYPCFVPKDISRYYDEKSDKVIISCIGGTRYDKGLDILGESFKYIDDKIKDKIVFNIVGKEEDIKFTSIKELAQKYKINIILNEGYMTDQEYWINIIKSDIILLPYRKIFGGNSGPMTDGVYMNKYIIGPNKSNIGYLIKKHKLGDTFEQENPKNLAEVISTINYENLFVESEYSKSLDVKEFINKYKKLYKEL